MSDLSVNGILALLFCRSRTHLFRAVTEAELADIRDRKAFRNPEGIECKYFARSAQQAERYARLATSAYGGGPFCVVSSYLPTNQITVEMCVDVESGIKVVVITDQVLTAMAQPRFVKRVRP